MASLRGGLAGCLTALLMAACTSGGTGTVASTGPSVADQSGSSSAAAPQPSPCGTGARAFLLPGPGGTKLEAHAFGAGRNAAVFLHEVGRVGMCGFWTFAHWLALREHVLVVLVNRCGYGASTCSSPPAGDAGIVAETKPAVDWARAHGARRVTLVGASGGASDALQAAGVLPHVAAVVDLSGDDAADTGARDRVDARRVHVPALFAVAPGDPYVSVSAVRAVYRLVPAHPKRLVIVTGLDGAHGWALLQVGGVGSFTSLARLVAEWVAGRPG
jgi:dienelactone hydrolase